MENLTKEIFMTQDKNCGTALGLLLIIVPILALFFGSDELAMQTDQAALVMTAMIFIGVITIANSRNKQAVSQPTHSPAPIAMEAQVTQSSSTSSFCPYCGAQVTASGVRYCAGCGKELPIT